MRVDVQAVVTNKTPNAPYRGAGRPETVFAMDRIVDCLARELGWIRRSFGGATTSGPTSCRTTSACPIATATRSSTTPAISPRRSRRRWRPRTTDVPGRAAALARAGHPSRHRHLRLRRGHRDRPVRGRDGEARSGRPRARGDGRDQLGSGPRDELRPGRRRRPRRSDGLGDASSAATPRRCRSASGRSRAAARSRPAARSSTRAARCGRSSARAAAALLEAAPDDIEIEDGRVFVSGAPASAVDLARVIQASIPTFAKPGVALARTSRRPRITTCRP